MRDAKQSFAGVESPVEGVHLVAEAVEPLEDGIELSVVERLGAFHDAGF